MITPEPDIIKYQNPEESFQKAIVAEVRQILTQEGITFILIEKFGLDIGAFIHKGDRDYARFIEIKTFVGSRMGGVGFGNQRGEGVQVDLLSHSPSELTIIDLSVLWLLGFGDHPKGNPRYSLFSSIQARQAAMGIVKVGKQNNFRISDFKKRLITWVQVSIAIRQFLLTP